jgi:hypothetical protein
LDPFGPTMWDQGRLARKKAHTEAVPYTWGWERGKQDSTLVNTGQFKAHSLFPKDLQGKA